MHDSRLFKTLLPQDSRPDSRLFQTFLPDVPDFSQACFQDSTSAVVVDSCSGTVSSNSGMRTLPAVNRFVDLHARVFASRVYNFQGLHSLVRSALRLPVWRSHLQDYSDYAVSDFLEFGWPVGFDYSCQLPDHVQFCNQKGAVDFPDAVDTYLSSETTRSAVIGPFSCNPFSCNIAVSPLNSVPKPDTTERRIILDLSWPVGFSVNDGIPTGVYLEQEFSLVYPTVDMIADHVAALGAGCLLFKRDLKRTYHQFPVYPHDYPLLGYSWNGELYFDVVLPMGLRTATMACQRATTAVCYILSNERVLTKQVRHKSLGNN